MADQIRKEIEEHTEVARGGDARDSQGDGVADAAAEAADAVTGDPDKVAARGDHPANTGTDDASGTSGTDRSGP